MLTAEEHGPRLTCHPVATTYTRVARVGTGLAAAYPRSRFSRKRIRAGKPKMYSNIQAVAPPTKTSGYSEAQQA